MRKRNNTDVGRSKLAVDEGRLNFRCLWIFEMRTGDVNLVLFQPAEGLFA
jgi:hypothetical protein